MEAWDTNDDFDIDDFLILMDASNQVKNSYQKEVTYETENNIDSESSENTTDSITSTTTTTTTVTTTSLTIKA